MPVYDYWCGECRKLEERRVNYEQRDDQWCDDCGEVMERHMPGPPGKVDKPAAG